MEQRNVDGDNQEGLLLRGRAAVTVGKALPKPGSPEQRQSLGSEGHLFVMQMGKLRPKRGFYMPRSPEQGGHQGRGRRTKDGRRGVLLPG